MLSLARFIAPALTENCSWQLPATMKLEACLRSLRELYLALMMLAGAIIVHTYEVPENGRIGYTRSGVHLP